MSTEWVVTTATERLDLNESRQGETTFTVTNPGDRADRAVFEVVPGDGADTAWFTVEEPQRLVRAATSVSYLMRAAVPATAAAGRYTVQARVYSADAAPEESSVLSNRVMLEVSPAKAAPRRRPWWPIAVAAAVVVAVLVTVGVLVFRSEPDTPAAPPPANVTVPDLSTLDQAAARTELERLGLVPAVRYRYDQAKAGQVAQSVPAGTVVAYGSTVELTFSVDMSAPRLKGPDPDSFAVISKPLPTLTWEPGNLPAPAWRVKVFQYACYYTGRNTPICGDLLTIEETVTTTSFTPELRFSLRSGDQACVCHFGMFTWQVLAEDSFGTVGPASASRRVIMDTSR
jgi:hypothetical protein